MRLSNFRNYREVAAEFESGLNLVVGSNGQGKTTLLEAIYCLSAYGSHRAPTAAAMIRHEEASALVFASGRVAGSPVEATAEIVRGAGMKVWLNKQRVGRGFPGRTLTAILFSPEDLNLIKGGPEERRRFLDHAAARTRPVAAADRLDFEKTLRQRNGVLKAARTSPRALKQLAVWNEQLARSGEAVVKNRLEVLFGGLAEAAARRYGELAGSEPPTLHYQPSWSPDEITGLRGDVAGAILEALEASSSRDLETASTSVGPHRDDLVIELGGAAARMFASQGEQRSLSLSLRMAERDLAEEAQGEAPILLLDDVFSELDRHRRDRLGELVASSGQTIATATAAEPLPVKPSRTLRVHEGGLEIVG